MENYTKLVTEGDIHGYIANAWETDEYRESHADPNGLVRKWVDKLVQFPVWFHDMVDPKLEYHQYTTLWRTITNRPNYLTPQRRDLYRFHEIVHTASLDYESRRPLDVQFHANERLAKVNSNALMYFEKPTLQARPSKMGRWVDPYFRDEIPLIVGISNRELYRVHEEYFELLMLQERDKAANGLHEESMKDRMVTTRLGSIWQSRYPSVRDHMLDFMAKAKKDQFKAADEHEEWIRLMQGSQLCPFQDEAVAINNAVESVKLEVAAKLKTA